MIDTDVDELPFAVGDQVMAGDSEFVWTVESVGTTKSRLSHQEEVRKVTVAFDNDDIEKL